MPSEGMLSAGDVMTFLESVETTEASESPPPEQVRDYREAAAVLAAIANPDQLNPVRGTRESSDPSRILAPDLIPATGAKFAGTVMLSPEVRLEALRELAADERVADALAANPGERKGSLQELFEQYLTGSAPPLEEQSLDQLDETHQIALWLAGVIDGVPSEDEVARRIAYRRLLTPFERIAGDDIFRGRKPELERLRSHIGILPPDSIMEQLKRLAFKWRTPKPQPALSISGPGGVGKSALIARFMLEHTRLEEEARVPFAYLDFDRADLDVGDPFGLSVEMIRQLDTQFSGAGRFEELCQIAEKLRPRTERVSHDDPFATAGSLLASVLARMLSLLGPRVYIVVLDTFEEVQSRGESRAYPLWQMLDSLQARAPFLRVVVAGRAPVDSLRLAGRPPTQIPLGELDRDAAVGFLKSQGVADPKLAEQLCDAFGGVPLTLKLIASLVTRYEEGSSDLVASEERGSLLVSLSTEVIQGQLYGRILDRIGDEQVRRLASLGLVLRRISPEIILNVLNETCELGLTTLVEAEALAEKLQQETSLVTVDDSDGALVHRADLRRVMLKLLVQSEPDRVQRIRRAAVKWYAGQQGRRAVAEAIYHRLHLGDWIEERELADREVRASIQTSVVEFSVPAQLWLATLGFQIPEETRTLGTLEQGDASLAAEVEELIPYGERSQESARWLVADATKDLDRPSPLFRSAARLALQRNDVDAARDWIERGLEPSVRGDATDLTLGLLQESAWLQHPDESQRRETLKQLGGYAERHQHREALLQHRLQTLDATDEGRTRCLIALEDLLRQAKPEEVWALTLAIRPAVELALGAGSAELLGALRDVVMTEGSPFRYAVFPDTATQTALEGVLAQLDDPQVRAFGEAYLRLCDVWPYRVLFVIPPYGRRGEQLAESVA